MHTILGMCNYCEPGGPRTLRYTGKGGMIWHTKYIGQLWGHHIGLPQTQCIIGIWVWNHGWLVWKGTVIQSRLGWRERSGMFHMVYEEESSEASTLVKCEAKLSWKCRSCAELISKIQKENTCTSVVATKEQQWWEKARIPEDRQYTI